MNRAPQSKGEGMEFYWKKVLCKIETTCMLSHFSRVRLLTTPWTVASQDPLLMGLSRQKYWSGLSCPPPGNFSNPGIEPASLMSPAVAGRVLYTRVLSTWEAPWNTNYVGINLN